MITPQRPSQCDDARVDAYLANPCTNMLPKYRGGCCLVCGTAACHCMLDTSKGGEPHGIRASDAAPLRHRFQEVLRSPSPSPSPSRLLGGNERCERPLWQWRRSGRLAHTVVSAACPPACPRCRSGCVKVERRKLRKSRAVAALTGLSL